MNYLYYPGCSLEGTAKEYDLSTRTFMAAVGAVLTELPDWTCCGASAAEATSAVLSLALPARNLALAQRAAPGTDVLIPCSACYLNLKKAAEKIREPAVLSMVNTVLGEEDLVMGTGVRPRHLLDVLSVDIGAQTLDARVAHRLDGLVIAPYYGCQCLRPYHVFDDPERPRSMAPLIEAVGATVFPWEMGARCCGASHLTTKPAVGLELVAAILSAARGADAIVTVCPMCQMNLEAYQKKASGLNGNDLEISILYLPQLLGLAVGLPARDLGIDLNLTITDALCDRLEVLVPV
ncbi:MAG: CoB--CoM heterodisulfide reductase iron-sulfur subunit B family protein [Pseudomonadota bacterium]